MRTGLCWLLAAVLVASFAVAAAEAQTKDKKASAKCPADFHQACMKRCIDSGGQPRFCPDFCTKRKFELGC